MAAGNDHLRRLGTGQGLGTHLMRAGLGSVAMRCNAIVAQLLLAVLLARTLGAAGYGAYAFAMATITILATPVRSGASNLVVRMTASYQAQGAWARLRGMWVRLPLWVLLYSVTVALVVAAVLLATHAGGRLDSGARTLLLALCLIALMPLAEVAGAALRGLGHPVLGQLPENVVRPTGLLLLVTFAWAAGGSEILSPQKVMVAHLAAAAASLMAAWWLLRPRRPVQTVTGEKHFDSRTWLRSLLPLSFIGGMYVINGQTDTVMIGWFLQDSDVGVYRVAVQGASLVTFPLMAMNMVVAPQVARLYTQGDRARLQRMVTSGARLAFAGALPLAGVFWLFGPGVLALVFGFEFSGAYPALAVLCIGQIVNAAAGSVGFILNMTGYERDTLIGVAVAAVLNVSLNAVLIPAMGILGAALASAFSMVMWNAILVVFVFRRTRVQSTVLGQIMRTRA